MSAPGFPGDLLLSTRPLILPTPCLRRAVAAYRDELGFAPVQQIPGVYALLGQGGLRLQLWQLDAAQFRPQRGRTAVGSVFALHAALARRGRAWLDGPPLLKPWGAWEFAAVDGDGNHLQFVQWTATAPGRVPASRGAEPSAPPSV